MILKILKDQEMVLSEMTAVVDSRSHDAETRPQQEPSRLLQAIKAQSVKRQEYPGAVNLIHQIQHLGIDANIRDFRKMLEDADAVQDSV